MKNPRNDPDLGIPTRPLAYALSVGACVGGIGSIMGSSANLVAMGICAKYLPDDCPASHRIEGRDFLKYGFPVLCVLLLVAMVYHWLVFSVLDATG